MPETAPQDSGKCPEEWPEKWPEKCPEESSELQAASPAARSGGESSRDSSWLLAALLLAVSAAFLVELRDVRRTGAASNRDPGPKALPTGLSLLLGAVGLVELGRAEGERRRRKSAPAESLKVAGGAAAWQLAGWILLYVVALPWIGFVAASWLFAAGALWRWGVHCVVAGLAAALLVGAIYLLFNAMFDVVLPAPSDRLWR